MLKKILYILFFYTLTNLAGCGGGGGGGGGSSSGGTGGVSSNSPNTPLQKSFSVSLTGVDVRRMSNGDSINLDTSAVSSDDLQYNSN